MRRHRIAIGIAVLAIAGGLYLWLRGDGSTTAHGTAADAGAPSARDARTTRPLPALPPRRPRDAAATSVGAAGRKQQALVGLLDTGALCEQHNARHCAALRAATERCDRDEADGCRAALALVDDGPLRDMSLAVVFARRACESGGDCARSQALARFKQAETDSAAREVAAAACAGNDAVACAVLARATGDADEARRHAERACRGGVIALGGCFELAMPGTPGARAALEHACASGSADGCYLLGRHAYDRGELEASRTAFARACELAPGSDGCIALDALEQGGSIDPE